MDAIRILVLCVLAAIVLSLGSAMVGLYKGEADSKRMLRALTVRISLSIALFILLMLAWWAGWITPRGVAP